MVSSTHSSLLNWIISSMRMGNKADWGKPWKHLGNEDLWKWTIVQHSLKKCHSPPTKSFSKHHTALRALRSLHPVFLLPFSIYSDYVQRQSKALVSSFCLNRHSTGILSDTEQKDSDTGQCPAICITHKFMHTDTQWLAPALLLQSNCFWTGNAPHFRGSIDNNSHMAVL